MTTTALASVDTRQRGFTSSTSRSAPTPNLGQLYGSDLRGVDTGDLTIGLLISARAAGDDTLVIFERSSIYQGPLAD